MSADTGLQIRFDHLSTEHGLPQEAVHAIIQDRDGFMWFGTQEGLVRYDGYEFTSYEHDPSDPSSLASSWVWSICESKDGSLWIGTDGGGLNRFDRVTETFERFLFDEADPHSLSSNQVRVIYEDDAGTLWVGTDDAGINRFAQDRQSFTRFVHDPLDSTSVGNDRIRAITQDSSGAIWIGTDGGGLSTFDSATGRFVNYRHDPADPDSLGGDRIRTIYQTDDGFIWVGTYEAGLDRFDPSTGTFSHFRHDTSDSDSLADDQVRDLLEDSHGTLWVATNRGLSAWLPEQRAFARHRHDITRPTSLSDDRTNVLFEDRGNVLWIGTYSGLNRFNLTAGSFPHYKPDPTRSDGLSHNVITAFDEDLSGDVWIGTYGGGLNRMHPDGSFTSYVHDASDPTSLVDDRVMALHVDAAGFVWIGTFNHGLDRFEPKTGTFTHFRHDPDDPSSLSSNAVTVILEDRTGILWVGTYRGGLNRFDRENGTFTRFRHDPSLAESLSSDAVLALHEDSSGLLWVGTDGGGLNRFDRGNRLFTHFRHDPTNSSSLSSDTAWSVYEDTSGGFWIGTQGGGLNYWPLEARRGEQNSFQHYLRADGLPSAVVYGVLQDGTGRLWASTNRGLSRIDPTTRAVRNYSLKHGLQGLDFNFGALMMTRDQRMFFGGSNGFNAFYPNRLVDNLHKPPIVLTGVYKFNQRIPLDVPPSRLSTLVLDPDDSVVAFEFAALDYTAPDNNRYLYKLEGFDEHWNDSGTIRRATYTNLDPGAYTLRVRGSNNDGAWSNTDITLALTVRPPWWQTSWAYGLYGVVLLLLAVSIELRHRKHLEAEASHGRQLEAEVAARTQELKERNRELADLNTKLESASYTDSLTGLMNRRYLSDHIETDTSLVQREYVKAALSMNHEKPRDLLFMMMDVDGLKTINDTYGHVAGDRALTQVKNVMAEECRKSDMLIRWGGDEFLVVGRQADSALAAQMAERLRSAVVGTEFEVGGGATVRLSCSIGFASYPFVRSAPTLFNWEQVLHMADRALYLAKESGRNRWIGVAAAQDAQPESVRMRMNEDLQTLVEDGILDLWRRGEEMETQEAIERPGYQLVSASEV